MIDDSGDFIGKPEDEITWSDPDATDNVELDTTVSCAPESGANFSLGITVVECTATDFYGNTDSCNFTVEIFGKGFF